MHHKIVISFESQYTPLGQVRAEAAPQRIAAINTLQN